MVERDYEGFDPREASGEEDLSEEQVKVYLFRARQRIKRKYTEIQEYGL